MDRVCNDHEALNITRNGEQSVVMLSLEDFKALEESAWRITDEHRMVYRVVNNALEMVQIRFHC